MRWYHVVWRDRVSKSVVALPHLMPETLRETVIANVTDRVQRNHRACQIVDVEVTPTMQPAFDYPGMIVEGRPWMTVPFDDSGVDIPCEDAPAFAGDLERALADDVRIPSFEVTNNLDGTGALKGAPPYVKLHGFQRALCLTVDMAKGILRNLDSTVLKAAVESHAEALKGRGQ